MIYVHVYVFVLHGQNVGKHWSRDSTLLRVREQSSFQQRYFLHVVEVQVLTPLAAYTQVTLKLYIQAVRDTSCCMLIFILYTVACIHVSLKLQHSCTEFVPAELGTCRFISSHLGHKPSTAE